MCATHDGVPESRCPQSQAQGIQRNTGAYETCDGRFGRSKGTRRTAEGLLPAGHQAGGPLGYRHGLELMLSQSTVDKLAGPPSRCLPIQKGRWKTMKPGPPSS